VSIPTAPAAAPVSEAVLAVRRWARTNLWAGLLVVGLAFVSAFVLSPTALDAGIDGIFFVTFPVLAVLEVLLLVALLRLFRDRDRALAASILVAGGASIVAGLVAIVGSLTGQLSIEDAASAAGGVFGGLELFLMALLLRRAAARPERLWLWAVAAGVGSVLASEGANAPDPLLVITGLLFVAYPVFLYRLGQLALPAHEPIG